MIKQIMIIIKILDKKKEFNEPRFATDDIKLRNGRKGGCFESYRARFVLKCLLPAVAASKVKELVKRSWTSYSLIFEWTIKMNEMNKLILSRKHRGENTACASKHFTHNKQIHSRPNAYWKHRPGMTNPWNHSTIPSNRSVASYDGEEGGNWNSLL